MKWFIHTCFLKIYLIGQDRVITCDYLLGSEWLGINSTNCYQGVDVSLPAKDKVKSVLFEALKKGLSSKKILEGSLPLLFLILQVL